MKKSYLLTLLAVLFGLFAGSSALLWIKINELNAKVAVSCSGFNGDVDEEGIVRANAFLCARPDWCGVDFTRLAAYPEVLSGKSVFILGYLAIDHGVVSLFATEEDYARMEVGRSLEIGGNRSDLSELFRAYGNGYVRIQGVYEPPRVGRARSARLGALVPPIVAREFNTRTLEQGVDDILVRSNYANEAE